MPQDAAKPAAAGDADAASDLTVAGRWLTHHHAIPQPLMRPLRVVVLNELGHATATSYMQTAAGLLVIDLGGTGAGAHDLLDLTGTAILGGALHVNLVNGYVPTFGQTIDILAAVGGVDGKFDTVFNPSSVTGTLPPGLKLILCTCPRRFR